MKKKGIFSRLMSGLLSILTVAGMFSLLPTSPAFAEKVSTPDGKEVEVIVADEAFGWHLIRAGDGYKYYLTYNGVAKCDDHAYWVYDETGTEYPAYCVSPTKPGATELGDYNVNARALTDDPQFYWILRNGYPYKTPQELGVSDDDEAYAATKFALWTHLNGWDLDKWAVNPNCTVPGDHSDVLAALKNIVAAARRDEGAGVPEYEVKIVPVTNEAVQDPKDPDYYSQTFKFEYDPRIEPLVAYVTWKSGQQAGMKLVNAESGDETNYYYVTEQFKVMWPKDSVENGTAKEAKIAAQTRSWIRAAMFGEAINDDTTLKNAQDYILAMPEVMEYKSEITATPGATEQYPRLQIEKKDDGSGANLEGAVFSVRSEDGKELGPVTTAENGVATIRLPGSGKYVVTETKAPADFVLDNTPRTVDVGPNQTGTITLTIPNGGGGDLQVRKIDAETGESLPGATIRLTHKDTGASWDLTTGDGGTVVLTDVPIGWYDVQEIRAPDGYILDDSIQTIKVEQGKLATMVLNNHTKPGLKIIKLDEKTKEPLKGATFRIAKRGGEIYGEYTTDQNGEIVLRDMPLDWYTITEISAPDGYVANTESQDVQLVSDTVVELTFLNRLKPSIEIQKVDSQTGKPLAGAEVEVRYANDALLGVYTTDNDGKIVLEDLEPGAYVVTEIKAPEGYLLDGTHHTIEVKAGDTAVIELENTPKPGLYLLKVDADTGVPLVGAKFKISKPDVPGSEKIYMTNDEGVIFLPEQDVNAYVIEEIEAPTGYILNSTPITVQLQPGERKEVRITNEPKPGLRLIKVDEGTNRPLAGAVLRVKKADGSIIGEYVTDETGTIFLPNLEEGIYEVEELAAPDGYILDPQKKNVQLVSGQTAQVTFTNRAKPGLQIIKVDSETKEPLEGATFRISKADGSTIGEYTTDRMGRIFVGNLDEGNYEITELSAPPGYFMTTEKKVITVYADETTYVEFENTQKPELTLLKIDALTGSPLAGAVFHVQMQGGKDLGNFTSDENGLVELGKVDPGVYIISEVTAPDGYQVTNLPQQVQLEPGDVVTVEIRDEALSPLYIKKVDTQTGLPVAGVKFRVEKVSGEFIAEVTTDRNGFASIPELEPGWYVVTEISVPDGYLNDSTPRTVEVKLGEPTVVEFTNTAKQTLSIKKVDADTGAALAGAKFRLEKTTGELVGEYVTDSAGLIVIADMEPGDYVVREIQAPDGYVLSEASQIIHMEPGKPAALEFTNSKIAGIQIKKTVEQTEEPLEGVTFQITKLDGGMIGKYTTDEAGLIYVSLEPGWYIVTETDAPNGYEIDSEPRTVEVKTGEPTVLLYKDAKLSGIRIRKVDADTGRGIYGVRILIKDENKNIVGEYTTDQDGYIELEQYLPDGIYYLEEIQAPDGYDLDTIVKRIRIENGKTKEIRWENAREKGQIQVVKKSLKDNPITGKPAGSLLEGAVFEISRADTGLVVSTMVSDYRGVAASEPLPLGRYIVREVKAPDYYALNSVEFEVQLKIQNDIVRVEVLDDNVTVKTSVKKSGNTQVAPGSQMRYDFSEICNLSNVPLDNFFWHDQLPTNAVRLEAIHTGTWNQVGTYNVMYKTNLADYRVLASGLQTSQGYDLDCSAARLGLRSGEYITDIRFEFGTVFPGFRESSSPMFLVTVLPNQNGYQFANHTDVGGLYLDKWITSSYVWITTILAPPVEYPQTGY